MRVQKQASKLVNSCHLRSVENLAFTNKNLWKMAVLDDLLTILKMSSEKRIFTCLDLLEFDLNLNL